MLANDTQYRLVYDVAAPSSADWWPPIVGGGLALGLLLAVFFALRQATAKSGEDRVGRRFGTALLSGGVLLTSYSVIRFLYDTRQLTAAVHEGRYTTVEGVVEEFAPGDLSGKHPERWAVVSADGRRVSYAYWPMALTAGYSRVHGLGGSVDAGRRVRVTDVGGTIARLEVVP
jgi:hypothetical protein